MAPVLDIKRTSVDGVPCFWADVPGPRTVALTFGVGWAHERAATSGISHLVEHLALAPLSQQDHPHNGFVSNIRTVIFASGTDDELVRFFDQVSRNLVDLPVARVAMERRILRQEAAARRRDVASGMTWFRFGSTGHGLVGDVEIGLEWLGPEPIAAWAETMFVTENAALWSTFEIPKDFRLHLPHGERAGTVPLASLDGMSLPAHVRWRDDGVAISFLAQRGAAARACMEIAAFRAREVLRFQRGLVYDIVEWYEPLDAATAHCVLAADCTAADAPIVAAEILAALDDMAAGGTTEQEIRRVVRGFIDTVELPEHAISMLDLAVGEELEGGPHHTPEQVVELYKSLDAHAAAATMSEALGTLILACPGDPPPGREWRAYPQWSSTAIQGRVFRPRGWPLRSRKRTDSLVVGPDGVTWLSGTGGQLTVRYDECVAYQHWEGPDRLMWGKDGFRVQITASEWRDGDEAVRLIDSAVPDTVVACDEHGLGALEEPRG